MANVINVGTTEAYDTGNDPIIVRNALNAKTKGVMLDVSGYELDVIKAGQVIIVKDGVYKPMPISDGAYGTLTDGYSYAGIAVASVLKTKPFVGMLNMGEVNDAALPYSIDAIKADIQAALPALYFDHD